jgi:hypothetical protein
LGRRKGVLKTTGQVFGVLGAAVLAIGAWLWLAGHDLTQPAGRIWSNIDVGSLNLIQAIIQRYIYAPIWDAVFVPFLLLPGWEAIGLLVLIFAIVGFLFLFGASRRPRRSFRR